MKFIMSPDKMEMLINNDREWRTHILTKLDKLEQNQIQQGLFINTLKVKVTIFGMVFGVIGSMGYALIDSIFRG